MNTCPCGSGRDYAACCEPIITGQQPAETAEQLMRARYSAHVKVATDFIFESTHPDHREGYDHAGTRTWAETSEWHGLEILGTTQGEAQDEDGEVEFIARFRDKNGLRSHHERGQFKRKAGPLAVHRGDHGQSEATERGQDRPQRSLPLRERQQVQEMLREIKSKYEPLALVGGPPQGLLAPPRVLSPPVRRNRRSASRRALRRGNPTRQPTTLSPPGPL